MRNPILDPSTARDFVAMANFTLFAPGFRAAERMWAPPTMIGLIAAVRLLELEAAAITAVSSPGT